jgi:hypothetical protein
MAVMPLGPRRIGQDQAAIPARREDSAPRWQRSLAILPAHDPGAVEARATGQAAKLASA